MKQYLDILRNILENGEDKQPVRIENGEVKEVENATIGLPYSHFVHNMQDGFPLLTTKKVAWKSVRVELEFFINGLTDKQWLKDRNCNIWNEWANPEAVREEWNDHCEYMGDFRQPDEEERKYYQEKINDLGPIYGYQWRNFGRQYGKLESKKNGLNEGHDQLKSIVDKLKTNPYDRRMVCSAWNPNQFNLMALPPCHILWQVVVYGNKISLLWFQRSVDTCYGLPFNIASYGLLLHLLAEESGLEPQYLIGNLADTHIYKNQIEGAKQQLLRDPRSLPKIQIKRKPDNSFSIFDWTYEDVELIGYDPHPKLDMGAITV